MQSTAKTVDEYLRSLPSDRRATLEAVRKVVLANLDPQLEEGMGYGRMGWYVPHSVYPGGYHCDPKMPVPYAGLAAQKNKNSLYLMSVYADGTAGDQWFRDAWAKTGKKLDMGKSCIRFNTIDDLALDVIGEAFRRATVSEHLKWYRQVDPRTPEGAAAAELRRAGRKATAKKPTAKKAAKKSATKRSAKKK